MSDDFKPPKRTPSRHSHLERLLGDYSKAHGIPPDQQPPERVTCLSLRYQIAQKIHAVTEEPADGRPNLRYWDLIDLILLRALLEEDLWRVREACLKTFENRATHSWPPDLLVPYAWEQPYMAEAEKLRFTPADVREAAAEIRAFIAEIDAAKISADDRP